MIKNYEPQFNLQSSFTPGVFGCSQEADSRFNWRVTVHHGDYFFHIMAVDENFERFALSLQKEGEAGPRSERASPFYYRYEVVNRLSELKPILDDLYASFERERRQQERINKAVVQEREKWEKRLAKERQNRWLIVFVIMFIAVLFVLAIFMSP